MRKTSVKPSSQGILEKLLLFCWYVTVASAPFGACLLRIKLPIVGHFFLFRGAILLTCFVYLLVLIQRRESPFAGFQGPERSFVLLTVCMLAYGLVSAIWAISFGEWFSKFFTMCQMFAMVFLFLKLCRNQKVMRNTMLLMGITVLICAVGGLVECFHGPFFDTPYRDYAYVFFNKSMFSPIFTSYNPNGFAVYLLFTLEILYLYLAQNWRELEPRRNRLLFWALSAGMMLTIFLCCADGGRLALLSIPLILIGLAVWLPSCYKKGLWVFLAFALVLSFVYVGENYNHVKYRTEDLISQVQQTISQMKEPPKEDQPTAPVEPPEEIQPAEPEPAPDEDLHGGTLYTVIPSVTGNIDNASIIESDGVRLTLLKNSLEMLIESKGLGIGLGNAEARMANYDNVGGLTNIHCFVMEVLLEFGVFALIPLLIVILSILKALCLSFIAAVRTHDRKLLSDSLLLLFTAVAYPLLSTANSSSWGIQAMWLYLAQMLFYTVSLQHSKAGEDGQILSGSALTR